MPLLAGTVPVVPALDALEKALTNRDAVRIILELSQWELRRLWASIVAQAILEEADRDQALDRHDIAWLEGLVSDQNHDEGTIRYCAIDLSWRRLIVERLIDLQEYKAARSAVENHLTSPNARLLDLMKHEPPAALEHVHTLGRLYEEHLDRVDKLRAKEKRTGAKYEVPWPPERLKQHLEAPDEELLLGMTADWARCTLRLLRRMDQICRKCRPHIRDLVYAPTPDRAGPAGPRQRDRASSAAAPVAMQTDSQDSLPTPDPSSDGVEALMRRSNRYDREASAGQRRAKTPPTAQTLQEKRNLGNVAVAMTRPGKRQRADMTAPVTSGPTDSARDSAPTREVTAEAAVVLAKSAHSASPPPQKRSILRDSSVQTSPPPEEKALRSTNGREATKSPSPIAVVDSAPSPSPERPKAHLAEATDSEAPLSKANDSQGPQAPQGIPLDDIRPLLMRGAAEQQQRLERDRRKSITRNLPRAPASPGSAPVPEPAQQEENVAADCDTKEPAGGATSRTVTQVAPVQPQTDDAPIQPQTDDVDEDMIMAGAEKPASEAQPRQRTLGSTSSAMLMPPPTTAGSRPSQVCIVRDRKVSEGPQQDRCPAERSSEPPNAASDAETSEPTTSGDTSSSNTSAASSQQIGDEKVIRDSQEEERPRHQKRKKPVPPTAAQHATISTHPILPLSGFTATTAAEIDPDISYEAPAAAQGDDSQDSDRFRRSTSSAAPFVLPAGSVPSDFELVPSTSSSTLSAGTVSHSHAPSQAALQVPTSSSEASLVPSPKRPARIRAGSVPPLEYSCGESGGPQSRASSSPPDVQNGKADREVSDGDLFSTLPESQIAVGIEQAERQVAARIAITTAALDSTTVARASAGTVAAGVASQNSANRGTSAITQGVVDIMKLAREKTEQAAPLQQEDRLAHDGAEASTLDDDDEDDDDEIVLKGNGGRGAALGSLDANELLPLSQALEVDGAASGSHRTDSSDENGELRRSNSFAGLAIEADQSEAEEGNNKDAEMWADLLETVMDDVES